MDPNPVDRRNENGAVTHHTHAAYSMHSHISSHVTKGSTWLDDDRPMNDIHSYATVTPITPRTVSFSTDFTEQEDLFSVTDASMLPLLSFSVDSTSIYTELPAVVVPETRKFHFRRYDHGFDGYLFTGNVNEGVMGGKYDFPPHDNFIESFMSDAVNELQRDTRCKINALPFSENEYHILSEDGPFSRQSGLRTSHSFDWSRNIVTNEGADDILTIYRPNHALDRVIGMREDHVSYFNDKTRNISHDGKNSAAPPSNSVGNTNFLSLKDEMDIENIVNDILNNPVYAIRDEFKQKQSASHNRRNQYPTIDGARQSHPDQQLRGKKPLPHGKVYRIVRRQLKQTSQLLHAQKRIDQQSKQHQHPATSNNITTEPSISKIRPVSETKPNVDTKSPGEIKTAVQRTIFTYKRWDGKNNRWRRTKTFMAQSNTDTNHHYHIPLSRGGELNVFPNLIQTKQVNRVKKELLESKFWRKYSIQGGDEPRLHFLAHDDATEEFDKATQPGYRYANITLKARPLSSIPSLHQMSKDLAALRKIPDGKWNIGVHPVLYRDSKDSMGDHADDDQGETLILCVLLDSPPKPRKVVVKVFDKLTGGKRDRDRVHEDGDEYIELLLRPGDAYEMNGLMQESYSHCVPKDSEDCEGDVPMDGIDKSEKPRRMCVVLRTGEQKYFEKDTGQTCSDLSPRMPLKYVFGHIPGLKEGKLYSRRELKNMNAFQLSQRGISGSHKCGADAIIVSGKRCGNDDFENLKYVAEWRIGANALLKSFLQKSSIRVFRSSTYIDNHSNLSGGSVTPSNCKSKLYRYDGLYNIIEFQPPADPKGTFQFFLNRHSSHFFLHLSFDSAANELFRTATERALDAMREATTASTSPLTSESRKSLLTSSHWNRTIEFGSEEWCCFGNLLLLNRPASIGEENRRRQEHVDQQAAASTAIGLEEKTGDTLGLQISRTSCNRSTIPITARQQWREQQRRKRDQRRICKPPTASLGSSGMATN